MEHVRWLADQSLRAPTLVYAFTGWNDAGDAASMALRTMIEQWGASALAEIDPEPFTDFATVRPHVRINDGRRSIVWPTVGVWSASLPGGDVLLVLGSGAGAAVAAVLRAARRHRRAVPARR